MKLSSRDRLHESFTLNSLQSAFREEETASCFSDSEADEDLKMPLKKLASHVHILTLWAGGSCPPPSQKQIGNETQQSTISENTKWAAAGSVSERLEWVCLRDLDPFKAAVCHLDMFVFLCHQVVVSGSPVSFYYFIYWHVTLQKLISVPGVVAGWTSFIEAWPPASVALILWNLFSPQNVPVKCLKGDNQLCDCAPEVISLFQQYP